MEDIMAIEDKSHISAQVKLNDILENHYRKFVYEKAVEKTKKGSDDEAKWVKETFEDEEHQKLKSKQELLKEAENELEEARQNAPEKVLEMKDEMYQKDMPEVKGEIKGEVKEQEE